MSDMREKYETVRYIVSNYPNMQLDRLREFVYKSQAPRKKYWRLCIPTKEKIMLNKMIEHVYDSVKENNDSSLESLDMSFSAACSCVGKAKSINADCEDVMAELERIDNYIKTGDWDA